MLKNSRRLATAAGVALACAVAGGTPAGAADRSAYADWYPSGQSGTVAPPNVGFPSARYTSDSTGLQVPSGNSTFLNEATPFGAKFGSSRGQGYLKFGTASGRKPSTTTITFDKPTPVGTWGFALGDIDADHVRIVAKGADGKELTAAELGFKGSFNYCQGSPRPSACSRPNTDEPTWNAGTATLVGSGTDTQGASGWFMPTVPVKSMTLTFSVQTGIPVGQLWMAATWTGKADIVVSKHSEPHKVYPGGTVSYAVKVTNKGTAAEEHAEFNDDLSDVIDDAHYNGDAHADAGKVTYHRPMLNWSGPVAAGQTRTITYTATVDDPPKGNKKILNAIIGDGPRMTCQDGKGPGCGVQVKIRKVPRPTCRLATTPAVRQRPSC